MERVTTLIATIGDRFSEPIQRVSAGAENVGLHTAREEIESLPEWVAVLREDWKSAQRRSTIYTVLTIDPLAPVVREWARRLDGASSDLELAIGLLSDVPIPDYYLVDPGLTPNVSHWYLDHLPSLAPSRVIVTEPEPARLFATISHLPYGPALPTTGALLESARTYVPIPNLTTEAPILSIH